MEDKVGNLRRNAFKIVATLSGNLNIQKEQHTLEYKFSKNHTDKLEISSNTITISGTRSQKPNFDDVFKNNQSEIYFQFIKSYVFYSITNGLIPEIQTISCYDKNGDLEKKYNQGDIRNLEQKECPSNLQKINKSKLSIIFKSTHEGTKYLYAATTLIRSFCTNNENDRFEKIWKSYNSIYRVRNTALQERQCLEHMGDIMRNTPTAFPLSTTYISKCSKDDIRNATRWYAMLENEFITRTNSKKREKKFSNFLTRYYDFRLLEIAQDTIDFKDKFWTTQATRQHTLATITARIANPIQSDIELVDVLCNCYMYYLRNKTLHGEQADHSFRFIPYNKESKTLKFSSDLLFLVICDLINNHNY